MPGAAYFIFIQEAPDLKINMFCFKLFDDAKIAEGRRILADTMAPDRQVQGTIVQKKAAYNPNWSYHLDPDTITFFERQIEVCDANMTYVEEHLDEIGGSTLPRSFWCPWSSRLAAEVTHMIDPSTERWSFTFSGG